MHVRLHFYVSYVKTNVKKKPIIKQQQPLVYQYNHKTTATINKTNKQTNDITNKQHQHLIHYNLLLYKMESLNNQQYYKVVSSSTSSSVRPLSTTYPYTNVTNTTTTTAAAASTTTANTFNTSNTVVHGTNSSTTASTTTPPTTATGRSLNESFLFLNDDDHNTTTTHKKKRSIKTINNNVNNNNNDDDDGGKNNNDDDRNQKDNCTKYMNQMIPFIYSKNYKRLKTNATTTSDNTKKQPKLKQPLPSNGQEQNNINDNYNHDYNVYMKHLQSLKNENEQIIKRKENYIQQYVNLAYTYEYGLNFVRKLNDLTYAPDNILKEED